MLMSKGGKSASLTFRQVHVYDSYTGEPIAAIRDHFQHGQAQPGELLTVAWSPDGTRVAC